METALKLENAPVGADVFRNSIGLSVSISRPGNKKKVAGSRVEVDADKDLLHISKDLLDSPEFKAISKHDSRIGIYMRRICLPSPFKAGIYLVPIGLIEDVDKKLSEMIERRKGLVNEFLVVYPAQVSAAKDRLRALYNENDYPDVTEVRRAFRVETQFINFSTPGELQTVSRKLFEREKEKAERKWTEAAEEIQQVLRAAMAELVGHMVERLTDVDGKRKKFHKTLVTNMSQFLDTFEKRNITNDADLADIVGKARKALEGVDVDGLKQSDALRENVRLGFEEIKKTVDAMVIDRPKRAIEFDESEGDA